MKLPKFWYKVLVFILLSTFIAPFNFVSSPKKAHAAMPANQNASAAARTVLDYFWTLKARADSGQTTNRLISGQQIPTTNFNPTVHTDHIRHILDLYAHTGKWVGIVGSEYWTETNRIDQVNTLNSNLIKYWNNGNLITLNWHAHNPWTQGPKDDRTVVLEPSTVNGLITNGTPENNYLKAEYDIIANYLTVLKNAGVVVLWRPYHEMNMGGGGFWWGTDKTTPADYAKLWRYMFDYFTTTKGLNNLLWVYAPNNQWSATSIAVDYYYPGDSYVDIVGQDVYAFDAITLRPNAPATSTNSLLGSCDRLADLGKPFGLSEIGAAFNKGYQRDGSWDNRTATEKIKSDCPGAVYFQQWNSWPMAKLAIIDASYSKELLNDPWVITREEFPWQAPNKDTQAPVISSVAATPSLATPYTAKITWKTNEHATSLVKYGTSSGSFPNTAKGLSVRATNNVSNNEVYLNGLQPNKKYYFVVNSTDVGGNTAQSSESSFTTISSFPNDVYTPDSQGYIKNWAAVGAYLKTDCYPDSGRTCKPPFDGGVVQPSVGEESANRYWIDINSTTTRIDANTPFYNMGKEIDEMQPNQDAERTVSYFHAYVYSSTSRSVQLKTQSDDGRKVWLNSNVVLDNLLQVGDYNTITTTNVNLNAGWNRLMIAVSDFSYGYAFSARFTTSTGTPITDLQIKLSNTQPSGINLAKEVDKQTAKQGEVINYTIKYNNSSLDQAYTNVKITDPIAEGISYVAGSAKLNGSVKTDSCSDSDSYCLLNGVPTWSLSSLAPSIGGSATFQVIVQ